MPSSGPLVQAGFLAMFVIGGITLMVLRMRAAKRPTTLRKIIIPPLGMMSGFIMFALPMMRIPWMWGLAAFGTGLLIFSFPLIVTTRLEKIHEDLYIKRSKAFLVTMVSLFVVRIALHGTLEQYMTIPQTGAIFFLLAFGMIIPWRISMLSYYFSFKKAAES